MSHHAQLSPEAIQRLQAQKRNSTISAVLIALLLSALIVAALFFIALSPLFKNDEELVSYSSGSQSEDPITKPELTNEVEKKPSSPSSAASKVIASSTPSPIAIPVPKDTAVEPSLDFGSGNDFGDGWGGSGAGAGSSGGGGASFFEQEVKAERIAYVIDYSLSMKNNNKLELMKAELSKSVASLPDSVEYSLIFFAGPAWLAGDKVVKVGNHNGGDKREFTVKSGGRKFDWTTTGVKNAHGYRPSDPSKIQEAKWIKSSDGKRKQSLRLIKNTPMIYGTVWKYPLEMALNMNPKPDVIFFMTDGTAGPESATAAETLGNQARRDSVIVNTVVLLEPKARKAMGKLAKTTGGIFTIVEEDGSVKQIDVK